MLRSTTLAAQVPQLILTHRPCVVAEWREADAFHSGALAEAKEGEVQRPAADELPCGGISQRYQCTLIHERGEQVAGRCSLELATVVELIRSEATAAHWLACNWGFFSCKR
jgi:hypothetical protein